MKVCIVSLGSLPVISAKHKAGRVGGAEVQMGHLATALARHGHETSMVVAGRGQLDGAVLNGITTFNAFDPDAGLPVARFLHPRATGLWRAMARADAGTYMCSTASATLGLMAMYCRFYGRRLVFRVASDSDCDPSRLLIKYSRDRWLYRYGISRADAILVQSKHQHDAIFANFGRTSVIVRGLVEQSQLKASEAAKDIDVLWVANLRQLKRPDRFIDLARTFPEYTFHMVGGPSPGDESLFFKIEAQAKEIVNLVFHGSVPYMDVGRLFDRARLFVNTSEIEGFPNTFLQAWVRGIPVITLFDPDGIVRRFGLGSADADTHGMILSIRNLLQSSEHYEAAREAAAAYMKSSFSEASILEPYLMALAP
jgi:glycosyltransferase involved in cell wall biosynthesis